MIKYYMAAHRSGISNVTVVYVNNPKTFNPKDIICLCILYSQLIVVVGGGGGIPM